MNIRPENILIKYSNPEKTNFDSFLWSLCVSTEPKEYFLMNGTYATYEGIGIYIDPLLLYKYRNICDIYSIGLTMYFSPMLLPYLCLNAINEEIEETRFDLISSGVVLPLIGTRKSIS